MNATKTVILTAGLCTMLFAACKKSEYMSPDAANVNAQTLKEDGTSDISVRFTNGNLNASLVMVHHNGQLLAELPGQRSLQLSTPIMKSGLNLSAGHYEDLVTTLLLKAPAEGSFSLYLTGEMTTLSGGDQAMGRRVDFLLNSPIDLRAHSGLINLDEQTSLLQLLNLRLGQLTANIPPQLWQQAMDQNPYAIRITAEAHPELHRLILMNLNAMMEQQPGNGGGVSTGGNSSGASNPGVTAAHDAYRAPASRPGAR